MRNTSRKSRAAPPFSLRLPCKQRSFLNIAAANLIQLDSHSRFAQLGLSTSYLPFAHRAREAIHRNINSEGKLLKVCSIHDERQMRGESAEGQAFVVLMEAAWRDWKESNT